MQRAAERRPGVAGTSRGARGLPAFAGEPHQGGEVTVEIALGEAAWNAFEQAAREQAVTVEQLLVHAAFGLAAELDREDPDAIAAELERGADAKRRRR